MPDSRKLKSLASGLLAASVVLSAQQAGSAQIKSPRQTKLPSPGGISTGDHTMRNPPVHRMGLGDVADVDTMLWMERGGKEKRPIFLPPFTEKQLIKLVKRRKKHLNKAMRRIEARGLAFDLTPKIAAALQEAGADQSFIAGLKPYTPSARAKTSVESLMAASGATPAEAAAYHRLRAERNPDRRIQMAGAFARKYPKSSLLPYVYGLQAVACWEKNDAFGVVAAAEKSLALQPHNLMALLLVSSTLPQPAMLRNLSKAEKEDRLRLAERYAKQALWQLEQLGKDSMAGGVYASLGMVHLERSGMGGQKRNLEELAKAEESYKKAIEEPGGAQSASNYFRLGEVYALEEKDVEAIAAYSRAKRLAPGTVIERLADRDINRLKQEKPRAATSQP